MINITLRNGSYAEWKEEYTDYMYDGKYFIVIKGEKWIGMYNLDCICSIVVGD